LQKAQREYLDNKDGKERFRKKERGNEKIKVVKREKKN
jgi:hypothetical protein